jgi:hypothetical protein
VLLVETGVLIIKNWKHEKKKLVKMLQFGFLTTPYTKP